MTQQTRGALATLLADQRQSLSGFFLRRVRHAWDAQDLLQELYLRLLRADSRPQEGIRNPEAYVYTVAANLLKEHAAMKQLAPLGGGELEDLLDRLATPCDAAAQIDRQLRRQRLAQLIARLSPKCRAVLVLHYRDELSYRQIAEQLDVSVHMVKKYVVKALTACRQGMARYE